MFVWKNGDLNPEQENAIFYEDSVLLVACPGSGKTRTLTYKIAYELSKLNSNKQYIIAITYTNRAADEIKERIELLGINNYGLVLFIHFVLNGYSNLIICILKNLNMDILLLTHTIRNPI